MADAKLARLTEQHAAKRQSLIVELLKLLLGAWGPFDQWRSEPLLNGQAALTATRMMSALTRTRRLERSYLQSALREVDALPEALPPLLDFYPRSGVSPLEVYRRPVEQYGYALSQGATVEEAQQVAEQRLADLVETDVRLAERDEAMRVYEAAARVSAYRRVIHPELSRSGTCGLCVVAAANLYSTDELLPLHQGCNCDTLPVTASDDPGFRLNAEDLKTVYAAAGGNSAGELLNTRVTVTEHGELGPVLVKQGDKFRDPSDVGRKPYKAPTEDALADERRRAREVASDALTGAEAALAAYDAANPDASATGTPERTRLFVASKRLRDYLAALDRQIASA
ncbi:hypothetical protein [Rathayibacter sp. Leaf248]|uniref:hypothetical protein n=1 Tax=Rathayibacter sp. Leaf248 TaxID=2876555 RepID=UPI001E3F155B|nr:hypothetical protein [Rathayibacter sp. Leaf248]